MMYFINRNFSIYKQKFVFEKIFFLNIIVKQKIKPKIIKTFFLIFDNSKYLSIKYKNKTFNSFNFYKNGFFKRNSIWSKKKNDLKRL